VLSKQVEVMNRNIRTFLILEAVALVVAILRFFMKGWLQPLGVSDFAGSLVASLTLVLLVGVVVMFALEGRAPKGSYWRCATWFSAFAIWCQGLIIAGILITAQTGVATYYEEMMGKHLTCTPGTHALQHGIVAVAAVVSGLAAGALVYSVAKRSRPAD
jgi:hypothetical protein